MALLPQAGREALATQVNLTEARANVLRTQAARLDLEANLDRIRLEEQRVLVELDKNAAALKLVEDQAAAFKAKLDSYTLKT